MACLALPNIAYCVADGKIVFLDVRGDRYFALACDVPEIQPGENASAILRDRMPAALKAEDPLLCDGLPHPREDIDHSDAPWSALVHAGRILLLAAFYRRCLKRLGLDATFHRFQSRTIRLIAAGRHPLAGDAERIAGSVRTMKQLLTLRDQCLPLALGLGEYLHRRGLRPTVALGVMARPFRAHSWVQLDQRVMSDRLEAIHPYTPIIVL